MLRDLRIALRTLLRQPSFTIVAVAILALGVGATTAMYSLMSALLLRPLPYPDSGALVRVFRTSGERRSWPHSFPNFQDERAQGEVFAGMAAFHWRNYSLSEPGAPAEQLVGMAVTADFFPLLEVQPALGRLFSPEEDRYQHNHVAVLSHEAWVRRFGGDRGIIGRRLRLDGEPVTIIGVMAPEFSQPVLWTRVDVWRPAGLSAESYPRERNWLQAVARLKPGVTLERAEAEMSVIAARLDRVYPGTGGLRLVPLHLSGMDDVGSRVAWLTMGLAIFVLLIACINLAGVQLARLAGRSHEHAIRVALGASRGWLVRQALVESLLLSLAGGISGIFLAKWCTDFVGARLVIGGGSGVDVPLDGKVVAFAMGLVVFTSLAVGAVPAWLSSREVLAGALRKGGRGTTDKSHPRLRQALVVAEMTLALVLLAAGGLFLRGLERFVGQDPGWKVDGLLTARMSLEASKYQEARSRQVFFEQLDRKLAGLPGASHHAIAWSLPIGGFNSNGWFVVEGEPLPPQAETPLYERNGVSSDYFRALGVTLREGRTFTAADGPESLPVIVVNEALARRYWPDGSAIGKRIADDDRPGPYHWRTIVGVVSDVRFPANLNQPVTPFQTYHPLLQEMQMSAFVALRAEGEPEPLSAALRQAVAELDPELSLYAVRTARETTRMTLVNFAIIGWMLAGFALLGLLLSALGVYGLFSGFVVQRTREIGVRMALGAQKGQVLRLVLGKGLRLALLGAVLGVAAAAAVAPALTAAAAALPAHDPAAVALLALVLVAVALFACWLPARRAAALDPMIALRHE